MACQRPVRLVKARDSTASMGRLMLVWAAIIGVAIVLLQHWLDKKYQPNAGVTVNAQQQLRLQPGLHHQYYVDGAINGVDVRFLVDTGASQVAVPAALARDAGLEPRGTYIARTANGDVQVAATRIAHLVVGGFELRNIEASINPTMDDDLVLLGMSAIKYLRLSQEGDTIIFQGPAPAP